MTSRRISCGYICVSCAGCKHLLLLLAIDHTDFVIPRYHPLWGWRTTAVLGVNSCALLCSSNSGVRLSIRTTTNEKAPHKWGSFVGDPKENISFGNATANHTRNKFLRELLVFELEFDSFLFEKWPAKSPSL